MKEQRFSRGFGSRGCTSALVSLMLAACGGGGGNGATTIPPTTPTTPTTPPATSTVFAEPSGALCAVRDANSICAEPTSSQASVAQLQALQQDATGDLVHFTAIGVENDLYQAFGSVASGLGVTSSQSNYALLEQTLVLGRNQVTEGSTTYAFSRIADTGNLEYASGENRYALSLLWGGGTPFTGRRNNTYDEAVGSDGGGHVGIKIWASFFGPLTDLASAPSEADVQFTGTLSIQGGDGSPYPVGSAGRMGRMVYGSCPITLTLHTSDGTLTSTGAVCTDPQTTAVIQFTLAPLHFESSRLKAQLSNEAGIQIEGPSGGLTGAPITRAQFASSQISGAVYGPAAAGIAIVGSSPQGMFNLVAVRQ
ncbi:hypothetical protein BH11PSE8_BH11PSE8_14070 [soil metagenome]